ncbi:MAG: hypothetical protein KDH88_13395 [Chromatiales bacterium]|nr:hypothetical protein [Chromatiales bacterium]
MSIKKLINRGISLLNWQDPPEQMTLIVVGTARGGTSLAAGVLHHLGVFLGDTAADPVFEDTRLALALEEGRLSDFRQIAREYDQAHAVWGWKRPSSLFHLNTLLKELRNPVFIFLFRDAFSVASRNSLSVGSELVQSMANTLDEYQRIVRFIQKKQPVGMLVSYDKALRNKEEFVDGLAGLLPGEISAGQREQAQAFITPNPTAYLLATRQDRIIGSLDLVDAQRVAGWASYPDSTDRVTVDAFLNGEPLGQAVADQFREDLKPASVSVDGHSAFEILIPEGVELRSGDSVTVRARGDLVDLPNSPWTIS